MENSNRQEPDVSGSPEEALSENMLKAGYPSKSEASSLRKSGFFYSVSDLLWIVQAALVALALGFLPELAGSLPETDASFRNEILSLAIAAAIGTVVIGAARTGLQRAALNMSLVAAQSIQGRVRDRLLQSATTRSPVASFPSSGAFASHVTDQVTMIGPYYQSFSIQNTRVRFVPIAIVFVTFWISWLAALILLVAGPIIPVFMALIGTRAKAASAGRQEELSRLGGTLLDRIRGLETLRLFGALEKTSSDIETAGETFRKSTMQVLKIAFLSSTVLELFSALGIAFCAVYIGFSLLGDISIGTWGTPLSFAGGLFVLLLAPEFFAPMRAYASAYHDRAAGLAALEKLALLECEIGGVDQAETSVEARSKATDALSAGMPPAIRFDNLSLTLAGRQVLANWNLSVEPGETVLLNGPSGSGKTTILDCLLDFHSANSGRVLVNGCALDRVSTELRQGVMWLGQEPRLFYGSVRSNLLKGHPNSKRCSDDDLWKALEIAGADRLVRKLPRGLATRIGEDGFGLSVGEIRRIALARAAMRQEATLLLVDEPTAGLDRETATDVINGLETLVKGRTALIATHDPSVLQIPGRLVTLIPATAATEVREPA